MFSAKVHTALNLANVTLSYRFQKCVFTGNLKSFKGFWVRLQAPVIGEWMSSHTKCAQKQTRNKQDGSDWKFNEKAYVLLSPQLWIKDKNYLM